uniref:arabinofuranosidase catalytic domain-containing protein n=1 Tax=Streptomyces sp. SS7 TaxID=3108485 RepID=UPI00403FD974
MATLPATLLAALIPPGPASADAPGPWDLYAAGGTPCVAAHSTMRALYASTGCSAQNAPEPAQGSRTHRVTSCSG